LPFKAYDGIRPTIDEFGRLDWDAFVSWDWERLRGHLNKARYKADRLEEGELQWALIMLGVVQERLSV
jgi:hypothetical protein